MGGYGIVGGNLPIAAGFGLASDYLGTDDATLCTFGDGASEPGHVRRDDEPRGAVEAAGGLHGHQQPVRHGHRARAPLGGDRPAAQGRGLRRAGHGVRRHGRARHLPRHPGGAAHRARGAPPGARRGDHLPLPRPLDGRPRGVPHQGAGRGVAQARPDPAVGRPPRGRGDRQRRRARAVRPGRGRAASTRRWPSPTSPQMPAPESLYDDVYVLGGQVHGWYSVDERSAGVHKGEDERELAEQHGELQLGRQVERDGRRPAADDGGRRGRRGQPEHGRHRTAPAVDRHARAALPRGAQRGAARGDAARRARHAHGRGHRRLQRRLQGHRRAARGVRREARARHADLREHDRRHGRRRGDDRACAPWSSS